LLPGESQVYYVGLLNGPDDKELFEKTGNGREVNRHHYSAEEIDKALQSDVTLAILGLARLRRHEVFSGTFDWQKLTSSSMRLSWTSQSAELSLQFEFAGGKSSFSLALKDDSGLRTFSSVSELANL
jgi:sucrose phosphorylase